MGSDYPERKGVFALKFIKTAAAIGVANEIGPEAFSILIAVAVAEDNIGYSRAPTFWNNQLQAMTGIRTEASLNRHRKRAIEAGWLVYEPGGKRRPGIYWVTFPGKVRQLSTYSICTSDFAGDSAGDSVGDREVIERQCGGNVEVKCRPSLPSPNPYPVPIQESAPPADAAPKKKQSKLAYTTAFEDWWKLYPKRVSKGDANKAFPTALKHIELSKGLPAEEAIKWLTAATIEYAQSPWVKSHDGAEQFLPHPATWLRAANYDDERSQWKRTRQVNGTPVNGHSNGNGHKPISRPPERPTGMLLKDPEPIT